ncbi:hypothetical protein [Nocardia sp. 348MFTsu5.1]|uniref:hypothetical protein n=1 Tax=Nocardia sp. 348MFTsu5.1 TaxID=1172185 RepID=UPI00036CC6F1|nr:hypothetical protein [Nocardia sp. 348MFTsu5.1]
MFGNERTEKLALTFLALAFLLCVLVSLSVWLTVFFGLLAVLQAVGVVEDMTSPWRI